MNRIIKTGYGLLMLAGLAIMLSMPVNAYLDPSVTTYAIQAVAGIIVAVGAAAGIYWRKARKKLHDKLGIDENAKKEVEDDIEIK